MANLRRLAECIPVDIVYCEAIKWILVSVTPCILTLGTLGSIATWSVLLREKFREKASSIFLMCLAMFDLLFLWMSVVPLVVRGFRSFDLDTRVSKKVVVTMVVFSTSSQAMSLYMMAMIAIERVICICYPIKAKIIVTRKICICLVLGVTACIVTIHSALALFVQHHVSTQNNATVGGNSTILMEDEDEDGMQATLNLVLVIVVNYGIPIIGIVIGNAIIIRRMFALTVDTGSISRLSRRLPVRNAVTKSVVVITLFYFITASPFFAYLAYSNAISESLYNAKMYMTQYVLFLVMLLNHACNFLFYTWTGSEFRNEFTQILYELRSSIIALCQTDGRR